MINQITQSYVKFKTYEELSKLAHKVSADFFYMQDSHKNWGIWKDDAGKVVDLYSGEYVGNHHSNRGRRYKECYNSIKEGIEINLIEETNPEYYL